LRLLTSGSEEHLVSFLAKEQLVRNRGGAPALAGELKEFLVKLPRFGAANTIEQLLTRPEILSRFRS